MTNTKIEWCDATWNPLIGCAKVSDGCKHCYADALNHRYGWTTWGSAPRRSAASTFNAPLRWAKKPWVCDNCGAAFRWEVGRIYKPLTQCACGHTLLDSRQLGIIRSGYHRRRVFLGSMMDLFYEQNRIEDVADILDIVRQCEGLDFLVLTKRPERWHHVVSFVPTTTENEALAEWADEWSDCVDMPERGGIPSNIWLGTSVENQETADERIPALLQIPAKVRFLSVEPLLGPVRLEKWLTLGQIHWVITGGES